MHKSHVSASISYQSYKLYSNIIHQKTYKHKNTQHDIEEMIKWPNGPETITPLTKSFNRYASDTYIQTDTSTQDMPEEGINCIQTLKLISAHFGSVQSFCNVLEFCPVNSKKKVHNF